MKMGTQGRVIRAAGAWLAGFCLLASSAAAELQRVEAVGNYGIKDSMRSRVIPRDEALAAAIWESVSRVAIDVIAESGEPPTAGGDDPSATGDGEPGTANSAGATGAGAERDDTKTLRQALGTDVLPYTRSFRILEDRGEVPVLFAESPDIDVEYVVVVEVIVDVDRVTRALESAGLVARAGPEGSRASIRVELLGLSRYAALEAVVSALREGVGATRVETIEFERERQVLLVEGPFDPEALSARLGAFDSTEVALEPISVDSEGRRIRVLARWFPRLEGSEGRNSAASDGPAG